MQLAPVQMDGALGTHQAYQHKRHAHRLGNHRGNGNARHTHVEQNHQHQVQQHINDACNGQVVQRAARVAHSAQNGRTEVIQHVEGHAHKVNLDIQRSLVDHILRAAHQLQQRPAEKHAHSTHQQAGNSRHRDGRVHAVLDTVVIPCAIGTGNHHACTDAQPHKHVHQQVNQRAGGAHRRQRRRPGEAPHNHHVRGIVKQLQHTGEHQRPREGKHLG